MKTLPLLAALLIALCCACGASITDAPQASPEQSAESFAVTESGPVGTAEPEPSVDPKDSLETYVIPSGKTLEFYLPSGADFGLDGVDALLYNRVVEHLTASQAWYWTLAIPTIKLLGTFPSADAYPPQVDGGTCYVLQVTIYFYNNIYPNDWSQAEFDATYVQYCRITLADDYGNPVFSDIYIRTDGGEPEEKAKMLWGPLDGPVYLISDETIPTPIREFPAISSAEPDDVLNAYLDGLD